MAITAIMPTGTELGLFTNASQGRGHRVWRGQRSGARLPGDHGGRPIVETLSTAPAADRGRSRSADVALVHTSQRGQIIDQDHNSSGGISSVVMKLVAMRYTDMISAAAVRRLRPRRWSLRTRPSVRANYGIRNRVQPENLTKMIRARSMASARQRVGGRLRRWPPIHICRKVPGWSATPSRASSGR